MKRSLLFLLIAVFTISIYPQYKKSDHDKKLKKKETIHLPKYWEVRLDKTDENKDDIKVTRDSNYNHFVTGPAAIYYNTKNAEYGLYKIEAEFIQVKPSKHPEGYGLFFAGKNLQKDNQNYIYFLIRQDGKYLIKERNGKDTKEIVNWISDDNINSQNKNGQTINKLTITVNQRVVIFGANGRAVKFFKKSLFDKTVGIVGLRINHNLNVKVSGLKIEHFPANINHK
ncbi:MAG: hypothetical protein P8Z35_12145 [Ignavibacteriaceae bacterium]